MKFTVCNKVPMYSYSLVQLVSAARCKYSMSHTARLVQLMWKICETTNNVKLTQLLHANHIYTYYYVPWKQCTVLLAAGVHLGMVPV